MPQLKLSKREAEVLQLLAEGKSRNEIAKRLGISTATVAAHRASIRRKLSAYLTFNTTALKT